MGCATSSEQPSDQPSAADSQQEIQVVAPEPADDGLRLSQNGRASGVLPRAHFSRDFVLSSSEEEGEEAEGKEKEEGDGPSCRVAFTVRWRAPTKACSNSVECCNTTG